MPKSVPLADDDVAWLRANHATHTYVEQAARIGCCVDTLKRILVRLDLRQFDGAKYQVRRSAEVPMWTRPCIRCGSTERRPKNHYLCSSCRKKAGYTEDPA